MIRNAPAKHPASVKWYWLEWSAKELQNASIQSSSWTVPAPLSLSAESLSGNLVGVRLAGGSEDDVIDVVNQIITSNGETLHETLRVRVETSGH